MSSYPELLFILLVIVLPLPVAYVWAANPAGFLAKYVIGMAAGFVVWLAWILLIVRPKFRDP